MFSSGDGGWDVVDKHALPGVDGHVRDWPHTVDFLKPRSSQPTRPASGRELACAGVFAYQRDEWIFLCGSTAVPEERIPPIQRQETAVPEQRYRT